MLNEVPRILESYVFCLDDILYTRIQHSFDVTVNKMKKLIFPELIENLCQKKEISKKKHQEEIEKKGTDIIKMEQILMEKNIELSQLSEKLKLNYDDKIVNEKIKEVISKYKTKVTHCCF